VILMAVTRRSYLVYSYAVAHLPVAGVANARVDRQ
jgi:hypothetical protein